MSVLREPSGNGRPSIRSSGVPRAASGGDDVPKDAIVIGTGGTGTVYRIETPQGTRTLKVVGRPAATPRIGLRRELERLARVKHPGLATLHSVTERDGHLHVVRDWVEAPSLAALLAERRVLPLAEAAPTIHAVAEAIGALHRSGFVHGEVKPGHVLGSGTAAKLVDAGLPSLDAEYAPPEWRSHRIATSRSDLWQLGALVVHVLGGAPPTRGGRLPSSAPSALSHVVGELLAEDPRSRPFGVRPLLDALALVGGLDDVDELSGLVELGAEGAVHHVPLPPPLPPHHPTSTAPMPIEPFDVDEIPVGFRAIAGAWSDGAKRVLRWADLTAKRALSVARAAARRSPPG